MYSIAVALLTVLAVVFGLMGAVAPGAAPKQPASSSSPSQVTHFTYPPSYDSGWMNITDKCGQSFDISHCLDTRELVVDLTGKQTSTGGEHQRNIGGTRYEPSWSRVYGTMYYEEARSLVQANDDGYVLAGCKTFSGNLDSWLVKTDSTGDEQWDKWYGGVGADVAYSLIRTNDGGYAMAGYTSSYGAGSLDFWLIKTNAYGAVQWNKTYGGKGIERAWWLIQTSDGGYAIAGSTNPSTTNYDFWLVKTDSVGKAQWNATYGGGQDDEAYSVVQTSDGGYAMAGYTWSFGAGSSDSLLIKTDSSGVMQWNRTYGGTGFDDTYAIVQDEDNGYTLGGRTDTGLETLNYWLIKTDSAGIIEWSKTYGAGTAYSMIETEDGGYAIAGTGSSSLIKTDSSGNLQWARSYWGSPHSVVQAMDGGFATAGLLSNDVWLTKSSVESGLTWTSTTNNSITLYRGATDVYWNFVRVRVWAIQEPTWQYGDINQDGAVDAQDLYILGRNYGKTFSAVSLGGIAAVAGVHTYKRRKRDS